MLINLLYFKGLIRKETDSPDTPSVFCFAKTPSPKRHPSATRNVVTSKNILQDWPPRAAAETLCSKGQLRALGERGVDACGSCSG